MPDFDTNSADAEPSELIALVEQWASHFGYHTGTIDLERQDLSSFVAPDATLMAHAPLWRTKAGEEKAIPAADVRTQLARMLKWTRIGRHSMHMARHPDGQSLCLWFVVKARPVFLPVNIMRVPLAFVVRASGRAGTRRIEEIHEWAAATPDDAVEILVREHGWPPATTMNPHVAFGARS
ncbi:MAG: hypothetical protein AAF721_31200 [Myxococcota bacterium]